MAKKEEKTKKTIVSIAWSSRYSSTMEDDRHGRWARIAYAGDFSRFVPFYRGKQTMWDIAWIDRFKNPKENDKSYFKITPSFPFKGKHVHTSLVDAQKEVEKQFRWFIKMVSENKKKPMTTLKLGK